jgi:hypothetical protein
LYTSHPHLKRVTPPAPVEVHGTVSINSSDAPIEAPYQPSDPVEAPASYQVLAEAPSVTPSTATPAYNQVQFEYTVVCLTAPPSNLVNPMSDHVPCEPPAARLAVSPTNNQITVEATAFRLVVPPAITAPHIITRPLLPV